MKKRIAYLILVFAVIFIFFILQKPFFMLYNDAPGRLVPFSSYLQVMFHGMSLDTATTGYLTAIPWLTILISIWFKKFPLRQLLVGYYAIVCLLISLIFVGDMCLYPFWNFKLDASVFLYLDSPKNAMASVSTGFIILRILVILLLSGFVTWILYRITPRYLPPANRKITGTLATILLGGVLFIIIRGGVSESTSNIGQVYFCNDEFLNHSAVNPAFSLIASAGKTKNYSEQFNYFDETHRKELFDNL